MTNHQDQPGKKGKQSSRRIKAMTNFHADRTDPQGSYTGRPVVEGEEPVQDADDL